MQPTVKDVPRPRAVAALLVAWIVFHVAWGMWTSALLVDLGARLARWGSENRAQRAAVVLGALALGGVLYLVRKHKRGVYAVIEAFIGLFSVSAACDAPTPAAAGLGFAAGLYIIVRAADNYETAFTQANPPAPERSTTDIP
jgi:hypothetical protein